jgi:hypothetical protein
MDSSLAALRRAKAGEARVGWGKCNESQPIAAGGAYLGVTKEAQPTMNGGMHEISAGQCGEWNGFLHRIHRIRVRKNATHAVKVQGGAYRVRRSVAGALVFQFQEMNAKGRFGTNCPLLYTVG